jgi:hypothetical protein
MACVQCGALLDVPVCDQPACALVGASPPVKRAHSPDSTTASDSSVTHVSPSYSTSSSSRGPTPPLFDEQDIILDHFLNADEPPMSTVHQLGRIGLTRVAQLLMWVAPATSGWLVGKEPAPLDELMAAGGSGISDEDHDLMYAPDHPSITHVSEAMRTTRLYELLNAYLQEYGVSEPGDRDLLEGRIEPRLAAIPVAKRSDEAKALLAVARTTLYSVRGTPPI